MQKNTSKKHNFSSLKIGVFQHLITLQHQGGGGGETDWLQTNQNVNSIKRYDFKVDDTSQTYYLKKLFQAGNAHQVRELIY